MGRVSALTVANRSLVRHSSHGRSWEGDSSYEQVGGDSSYDPRDYLSDRAMTLCGWVRLG